MGHPLPLPPGETRPGLPPPGTSNPHCLICGLPAQGHLRCVSCTVLAGPGHRDCFLSKGKCGACVAQEGRQARA